MVASSVERSLVTEQLLAGINRALDDRRRIDELVTQFEYSGVVSVPGESQEYAGQGAVKRFLTTLLVDNSVRSATLDPSGAAILVSLADDTGRPRELQLLPVSKGAVVAGATLISQLNVHEETKGTPIFANAPASLDGERSGPKWETYDGRVRQRIWQVNCHSR